MLTTILLIIGRVLCWTCAAGMWVVGYLALIWGSGMALLILTIAALYSWLVWVGWRERQDQDEHVVVRCCMHSHCTTYTNHPSMLCDGHRETSPQVEVGRLPQPQARVDRAEARP